jgi:hypothetical protein
MFGYTVGEAMGKPMTILMPTDRHDEERVILERIRRRERVDTMKPSGADFNGTTGCVGSFLLKGCVGSFPLKERDPTCDD